MKKIHVLLSLFFFLFVISSCNNQAKQSTTTKEHIINSQTFTVSFDSNGGTIIDSQQIEKGSNVSRPEDPVKEGYTFDGWYVGDEKWSFLNNTVTVSLTLKAKWIINQYTLTIKYNDGVTEDTVLTYDYNQTIDSIPNPLRFGYTFAGWGKDIPSTMPAKNVVLNAEWTNNQYSLTIKYNDNLTEDIVLTYDYNQSIKTIQNPTRVGYAFNGWDKTVPSTMPAEDVVINAKWNVITYIVNYHLNNGTNNSSNPSKYTIENEIMLNDPIKEGYTFAGWYLDDNYTTLITKIEKGTTNNLDLYAKYTANTYTIHYDVNGGDNLDSISQEVVYGELLTLKTPTKEYYTFDCWLLDDNKYDSLTYNIPHDINLVAKWTINQYTLTLKNYYGDTDFVLTQDYNSVISVNNPIRTGYTFSEYSEIIPSTMPSENITIDVHWCINQYTLRIKCNDGITNDIVITQDYNSPIVVSLPKDIVKVGYVFNSWDKDIPATMPAEDIIINAKWICHVKYKTNNNKIIITGSNNVMDDIVILDNYDQIPVTSIGDSAFSGCSTLTSVTIPNSVTSIGNSTFSYCTSLTSITIPDSVTTIGSYAFQYCTSLTSITIPNSVTSIGISPLRGCSSLESITLPFVGNRAHTPKDTYQYPFGYIFGTGSYSGGKLIEQSYYGQSTSASTTITYYIPNSLKIVTITGSTYIPYGAFKNCSSLTSITIPDSVTSMGQYAFSGCSSLTSVVISNGVKSIGDYAFSGCSSLKSITIPNSVTSIGQYAFYSCSSLISIDIPNGVKSIGVFTFCNCSSLTSITIPNSVTSIGYWAFSNCSSLTSITIPDSVTTIENEAFCNCSSLEAIIVNPNNTKYDSRNACNAIIETGTNKLIVGSKNTIIPNSVTTIGCWAFQYCTSLTSITIPNSVTTIEYGAFHSCLSLISVDIPNSVTTIELSAFSYCSSLTSITIPNSVTLIGNVAFQNCSSLTIYCEASSKPSGWDSNWNIDNRPVVWGYTGE